MRSNFISYRRDDAEGEAGRLFDDLAGVFGEHSVFMDVAAIQMGVDFRTAIDESVATCGVLLAVIGKRWIEAKDETGQRRLDNSSDFVRLEIASALKRNIPVIPVLVQGAKTPPVQQLPDDLQELTYRNGIELTGPKWRSDVQVLTNALRRFVDELKTEPPPQTAGGTAVKPEPETLELEAERGQASPSPWKIPLILASIAIGAVAVGLLIYDARSQKPKSPNMVEVPYVVGMSFDAARQALEDRQLAVGNIDRETTKDKPPNSVLSQIPETGQLVKIGSKIDLKLSEAASAENPPESSGPFTGTYMEIFPVTTAANYIFSQCKSEIHTNLSGLSSVPLINDHEARMNSGDGVAVLRLEGQLLIQEYLAGGAVAYTAKYKKVSDQGFAEGASEACR